MRKKLHLVLNVGYFATGIFLFLYFLISGWDYYKTPLVERAFHPKHSLLKPSGLIGHGLGIIGSLMMIIGVSTYMIRKRWRKLHQVGYLKHWLEFHIFMCSVGPSLILFHTAFKFGGIISIGFWAMVIVVLSGVIGRVIYIQLPKTLQGENLSKAEMEEIISELLSKLDPLYQREIHKILVGDNLNLNSHKDEYHYKMIKSIFDSLKMIIKENSRRRRIIRMLRDFIQKQVDISNKQKREYLKISKKIISLRTKEVLYNSFDNLFRYWHIFHLPFAITMFLLMFIHTIVAILFGAKWIF